MVPIHLQRRNMHPFRRQMVLDLCDFLIRDPCRIQSQNSCSGGENHVVEFFLNSKIHISFAIPAENAKARLPFRRACARFRQRCKAHCRSGRSKQSTPAYMFDWHKGSSIGATVSRLSWNPA